MSSDMIKPTKWLCAQQRLSLGIRSVWSESSLSAWRKLGSLATHSAHSEDSDQTGRMPRLKWVFAGRSHFVGFVMSQLRCPCSSDSNEVFSIEDLTWVLMRVLLNLLNKLGKKVRCKPLPSILSVFPRLINSTIQEHECKILFIIWH